MIKKLKPRFFEFRGFGHNSTSNKSVDQCCIFLKSSFLCASFDVQIHADSLITCILFNCIKETVSFYHHNSNELMRIIARIVLLRLFFCINTSRRYKMQNIEKYNFSRGEISLGKPQKRYIPMVWPLWEVANKLFAFHSSGGRNGERFTENLPLSTRPESNH